MTNILVGLGMVLAAAGMLLLAAAGWYRLISRVSEALAGVLR